MSRTIRQDRKTNRQADHHNCHCRQCSAGRQHANRRREPIGQELRG